MRKSDIIRAKLSDLQKKLSAVLNDHEVTVEGIEVVENEIKLEEKKLEAQLKIEEQERAELEAEQGQEPENIAVSQTILETPENGTENLYNQARDLQNYILGNPSGLTNSLGTGTDTSGGVAVGTELSGEIIRALQERSEAYSFFSSRVGSGNFDIIVIAGETNAQWVAEGATPTADGVTTSKVTLILI